MGTLIKRLIWMLSLLGSVLISSELSGAIYRLGWWGLKTPGKDFRWDQYGTLESQALPGDTVQVYNSLYGQSVSLNVSKSLHFVGYGFFLQTNAGYQAIQFPDELMNIYLNAGSGGTTVQGLSANFFVYDVNDITIRNCKLGNVYLNNAAAISNFTLQGCWGEHNGQFATIVSANYAPVSNLRIVNNYLNQNVLLGGGSNGTIANNIFGTSTSNVNCNANASGSSNVLIKNNIVSNLGLQSCFFLGSTGLIKNNLFAFSNSYCPAVTGNGNVYSVNMNNTFRSWNNGTPVGDSALLLKVGSPALNAGLNNANAATDCGLFGGESAELYRQSGVPALPAVYAFSIASLTPSGSSVACTLSTRSNNSGNITRVEYYLDVDPGYGNGVAVSIAPGTNLSGVVFTIPLAAVSEGPHYVFVRSRDANGNWSLINSHHFVRAYNAAPAAAAANITRVEYYIDQDPGYGLATALSITPGANLAGLTIPINPNNLSEGVHTLYARSRDASGNWSFNNYWVFYRYNAADAAVAPNVTRVEYYIDQDPGYGLATALSITPGVNLSGLTIPIIPNNLSEGLHTLYARSRDANGNWSLINYWVFYRYNVANAAASANITRIEYYFDQDPGYGNGTAMNITPGANLSNQILPINPNSLSEGVHTFYVRSKDANGNWSLLNSWVFYRYAASPVAANAKINQLEYYFDTDPGYGQATQVALSPDTALASKVVSVNLSGIPVGAHTIWFRAKDSLGNWSLNNAQDVNLLSVQASTSLVTNSVSKKVACAGEGLQVTFQTVGTFNAGNVFTVQLSNSSGSFSAPTTIGTLTGTGGAAVSCVLPAHLSTSNRYKVRVNSSNPALTGIAWADSLWLRDRPVAQTISGVSSANVGTAYTFSVPTVSGSTWLWLAANAAVVPSANTASVNWSSAGVPKTVKVVQTSQYGCLGDTSSKSVNVYVKSIAAATASNLNPCRGSSFTVSGTASGVYAAGNIFTAQLSNAAGSFSSPVAIGTLAANPVGNNQAIAVPVVLPQNTALGTGYKVRIVSSNPAVTGTASVASLNVTKPDLGVDQVVSKCVLDNYNLTTVFTNPILTYQYFTAAYAVVATPTSVASGTYQIVAANANGCKDTAQVIVDNNYTPNLGPDQVKYYLANSSYNLTALYQNPVFSFSYRKSDWTAVSNPGSVTAGIYYIIASYGSCKDTVKITVKLGKPVAVMSAQFQTDTGEEAEMDMLVYPNPAHNLLQVDINFSQPSEVRLQIFDLSGKLVKEVFQTAAAGAHTFSIEIGNLAAGAYLLRYSDEYHNTLVRRFLKQ